MSADSLPIEQCTRADFDRIILEHEQFWNDDLTLALHHPIFIHEFGDSAFVIRDGDTIVAYLLGFVAQTAPTGYVHMVATRISHRGRGHARRLYEHFIAFARRRGCTRLKATCGPWNVASIRFHAALGMHALGEPDENGVMVVRDYLRPGTDRVVFEMEI